MMKRFNSGYINEMEMNSASTPENSLRKSFRMYRNIAIAALMLSAAILSVMILSSSTESTGGRIVPGIAATLSGLTGLLLLMVFVAGRHQIDEVDELLAGKKRIAHWRYDMDERNQPVAGYVYIGAGGIYKDGVYFSFAGRTRQLIDVACEESRPARLQFVYQVISRPNSRTSGWSAQNNNLIIPVPADKVEEARRVAAEFRQMIKGTVV